jgi:hypothetical protein
MDYSISAVLNNLLQSASVPYESVCSDMHLIEELQPFLLKYFVELMYILRVIKYSFNISSSKERDVL